MTHKEALFTALQQKGFEPQYAAEKPDCIFITKTPDPDHPQQKPYKLGMPFWLRLSKPDNTQFKALSEGVTLEHDDIGRTLYYLGKAVGCNEAIIFLKSSKHALPRALYTAGFIAEPPCDNWEYVDL